MRNRALYAKGIASPETDSKTKEEVDAYLENLEKDRKNQMALRKNYYREYISNAIKRAIPFNLTFDQFNNLISQNCAYCGQEPYVHESMIKRAKLNEPMLKCVGVDRVDSDKFYDIDNCVPCCEECNKMKLNMTTEKFLGHINKIHDYQEQKNNKLLEGSSTIPEGSTSQVDNGDGSGTPQDENKNDNLGEDIVTTV